MSKTKTDTGAIATEQLQRMLTRYRAALVTRLRMDGTMTDAHFPRALQCCDSALGALAMGRLQDARHFTGFVQGILLATGFHTWEYLATDDQRE